MALGTLQQRLDQALEARHKLLTGSATVAVGFGERRLQYAQAQLPALDQYIAELRRQIAGSSGPARGRITYAVPD